MPSTNDRGRQLTELDFVRLHRLAGHAMTCPLGRVLDEADVVPSRAIPADVVTMYAKFIARDAGTGRRQVFVLCYPSDAQPARGLISVLSPAGAAFLGMPVGATASWAGPGGEAASARIEELLFQPEMSGDYLR